MRQVLLLLLISLFLPVLAIGQVPQKFSYQAAVRNTDGSIMANQQVDLKVILRKATLDGDIVYQENHNLTTSAQGIIAVEVGGGQNPTGNFALTPWSEGIFIQLDIKKASDASFVTLGVSQILSVPYALHAGNAIQGDAVQGQTVVHNGNAWAASSRMSVNLNTVEILPEEGRNPEEPLFSVRNSEGLLVFAVYESGTRVYVGAEEGLKGNRGGFAVGGFSDQIKDGEVDYLTIYPDKVQFNILQPTGKGKGNRGGFAVGGFSDQTKGITHNFFTLKSDSAKFTLTDDPAKGNRGGFAVGGFSDQTKEYANYLTVDSEVTTILNNLNADGDVNIQGDVLTGGNIGSLPIVDIEGNRYETVTIGNQIWMKQNLRTSTLNDGSVLDPSSVAFNPAAETAPEVYGKLYGQFAISDALCPTGWHIPTIIEWEQLFWTVGGPNWAMNAYSLTAGLLDNSGLWTGGDIIPTNTSGFTAVPGGFGDYYAPNWIYNDFKFSGYFWSADGVTAYQIDNNGGVNQLLDAGGIQTPSFSVRCVKNSANQ
ncbi:MAG: fibrobacter succinogenes major paralogous domain-containing protein [Bacteroidales bacterium]|nr:fibrobacter succinogenes major paralogous domain-containing protein [Bacteroidales bacterium]MDD4384592.1 fibrobacter succinogenes major paralogous domain-containing protein [Bacteroidales bacterium]MDY0196888.1 fibrobacter succinogenes major paralogous domain-containing protein [Tenuifilaceae bacterium]